jgi:multidrug resistance efflux pump
MRRMKPGQLREHLAKLRREAENRQYRLDSLRAHHGQDHADREKRKHMFRVSKEIERLNALIDEGWRIHERQQTKEAYLNRQRSNYTSGSESHQNASE